jgi:ribosome-associated translation inhibitor RaiA
MQLDPEITYREVEKTDALDRLVRRQIAKIDRLFEHLTSCRVAIERPQKAHDATSGSGRMRHAAGPHRVRIQITVPPGHDVVVRREPGNGSAYEPLRTVIVDAFKAMRLQLASLRERQRGDVKAHADRARRTLGPRGR